VVLKDLSTASKLNTDWPFLLNLRDRGRAAAAQWLADNYDDVGKRQTVDLRSEFLNSGSEMKVPVVPTKRGPGRIPGGKPPRPTRRK